MRLFNTLFFVGFAALLSGCSSYFYPTKDMHVTPSELGLKYDDVYLKSEDGTRINAWYLPASTEEVKGTVIFNHGNSQNISYQFYPMSWLPSRGYNLFVIDYRGYGKSSGKPNVPGALSDIAAGVQWVQDNTESNLPVYMVGQSLGAALTSMAVGMNPDWKNVLDAVVLDAGFDGFDNMIKEVTGRHWLTKIFTYPAIWLNDTRRHPEQYVGNIAPLPLLMTHSEIDTVVPFERGVALFKQAGSPKYFVRSAGAHIFTFSIPACRDLLLYFFEHQSMPETLLEQDVSLDACRAAVKAM